MYFTFLGSESVSNCSTTTLLDVRTINSDAPMTYLLNYSALKHFRNQRILTQQLVIKTLGKPLMMQ